MLVLKSAPPLGDGRGLVCLVDSVKDAHKVSSPFRYFLCELLQLANSLVVTHIKGLLLMTHIERVRLLVISSLCGLAICSFKGWGDISTLQLAQSLLGAANIGVSQVEKRVEKSKE